MGENLKKFSHFLFSGTVFAYNKEKHLKNTIMIIGKLLKFLVKVVIFLAIVIFGGSFLLRTCCGGYDDGYTWADIPSVNIKTPEIPSVDIKVPEIKLPDQPVSHYIENMLASYKKVSKAKIGTTVKCPVCGRSYTKVETDGFVCCSRVCERAYRDIQNTYEDYKNGVVTFNEIKELVEDYFERLHINHE